MHSTYGCRSDPDCKYSQHVPFLFFIFFWQIEDTKYNIIPKEEVEEDEDEETPVL